MILSSLTGGAGLNKGAGPFANIHEMEIFRLFTKAEVASLHWLQIGYCIQRITRQGLSWISASGSMAEMAEMCKYYTILPRRYQGIF